MLYHAAKSAFRVGRVDDRQWDDIYIGVYSWAGGFNTKATGQAALAYGWSDTHSTIEASGHSSWVSGSAYLGSTLINKGASSLLSSQASNGSTVTNTGVASMISVQANQSSKVDVGGGGAGICGWIEDFSTVEINGSGSGNFVYAAGSGSLTNDAPGSLVSAYISGGAVSCVGFGASVRGYVVDEAMINAKGIGSSVSGVAHSRGVIETLGMGSWASGYAGTMERHHVSGVGSSILGRDLKSTSDSSVLVGCHGTLSTSAVSTLALAGGYSQHKGDGISVELGTRSRGDAPQGYGLTTTWMSTTTGYSEYFEWDDLNLTGESREGLLVALRGDKLVLASSSDQVIGVTASADAVAYIGNCAEKRWHGNNRTTPSGQGRLVARYGPVILQLMGAHGIHMTRPVQRLFDTLSDSQLVATLSRLQFTSSQATFDLAKFKQELSSVQPIEVLKTNSEWDPTRVYQPRSERSEWIPVVLTGRVRVRDDGTLKQGDRFTCRNGQAASMTPGTTPCQGLILGRVAPSMVMVLR